MNLVRIFRIASAVLATPVWLSAAPVRPAAPACDLSAFAKDENLWQLTPEQLLRRTGKTFRCIDRTRRIYLAKGRQLCFGKNAVPECTMTFDGENKLESMRISLYNRGDSGALDRGAFRARVEAFEQQLFAALPAGSPRPKNSNTRLGDAKIEALQFTIGETIWFFKSAESRRGGEFISLELSRAQNGPRNLRENLRSSADRKALDQRLVRKPDGTVMLDIPMVDQGQKGYCAVATIERIMRYYGADIDQHVFAELAGSEAAGGTSVAGLYHNLEEVDGKLRIKIERLDGLAFYATQNSMYNFVADYNHSVPRNARLPNVHLKQSDAIAMMGRFNMETFIKVRGADRSGMKRFLRTVRGAINQGYPLCWSICEPVPGKPPIQHMRIINGYNDRRKCIVYSDSYGSGFEARTMPYNRAWAISSELWIIKPR